MKKVSKKAHLDLITSVYLLFRERKDHYLNDFLSRTSDKSYLNRLEYIESVESLLLAHCISPCPNSVDMYCLERLRNQIKEVMH